jgi:hypothetical protein
MSRIKNSARSFKSGRVMTVTAAAVVAAAVAAPLATGANEGSTLKGGKRNGTFSSETKVIANNGAFGTRQSNLGSGGGAIYGCRATTGNEGCIEASNLNNGQAFNFRFNGDLGGTINTDSRTKETAKPFTTNATGVATGLNADRVDGLDAQQIVDTAKASTKIGIVTAQGGLQNARGLSTAAREAEGRYLVTADGDISKCVPSVTAYGTPDAPGANATVQLAASNQVRVFTQTAGTAETNPAAVDRQFSVTVNC